jgi:hypothetical protein
MQHDVAKAIGRGWSPELREAMELPEKARRLSRALKVAEKWMESAREGEASSEMWSQAEYTRDKVEEELSRVCLEMDVRERTGTFFEDPTDEGSVRLMQSYAISDGLMEAYLILRDAPEDLFAPARGARGRYELMGALMVALDGVNAELEEKPRGPEAKAST